jgi:hypothetical protein
MQCTDYMYTKIGDRGISKKRLTRFWTKPYSNTTRRGEV